MVGGPRKPRLPKRSREKGTNLDLSHFKPGFSQTDYYNWITKENRQDLAVLYHVFEHSRRLVVVTGAGISVAAGIPDFRSQTGLFTSLKKDLSLKSSGKAMFDASVYQDKQSVEMFHTTIRSLYTLCQETCPTTFHQYLNKISMDGRLCRLYTQNIDCLDASLSHLETKVPLARPWPTTVQLHGTLAQTVCTKCHKLQEFKPHLFETSEVPECPECIELESVRELAGKRSLGIGKLRPRIVLYNEGNPDAEAIGSVTEDDLTSRPDGLVVAGTTLKIPGVKRIVKEMAQAVHAAHGAVIWMNVDDSAVQQIKNQFDGTFDIFVKADCQAIPQIMSMYAKEQEEISAKKEQAKRLREEKKRRREEERKKQTLIGFSSEMSSAVASGKVSKNKPQAPPPLLTPPFKVEHHPPFKLEHDASLQSLTQYHHHHQHHFYSSQYYHQIPIAAGQVRFS